MMTLDANERRRITPTENSSPTHGTGGSVVLRPARNFNLRDNSPVNRHSYHGLTSPLMSPRERPEQMKRYSQQLQYPIPYIEPFNGTHLHSLGKQSDSYHSSPVLDTSQRCPLRKRWSANFALSALPERDIMSSNDSLAGSRRDHGVDTMQQGSELQDSPRGSVASVKREDVNYHQAQPQVVPQGSIPIQGQVLVDPATGQHYIVPQATFFPPAMQPMYFQPPTPVYYPYGQVPPQGYVMSSTPQQAQYSVPLAYQQRPYAFRPGYAQSTTSSEDISRRDDDRRLEDPPPSSPSLSMATQSGFFPPGYAASTASGYTQQYRQQQNPQRGSPNSQPEDPESGRDGFRRDVTRSSAEYKRISGEFHRQGSGEFNRSSGSFSRNGSGDGVRSEAYFRSGNSENEGFNRSGGASERTPLYGGPPPWWGRPREDQADTQSLTDLDSPRMSRRMSPPGASMSESESARGRPVTAKAVRMDIDFSKVEQHETPKPKPTTSRSVRMDIDLSKLPDETETREKRAWYCEDRNSAPQRAPATAFTVNFDSPSEEVSLQDAARKSAQARRILNRRSGGANAAHRNAAGELPPSNPSNKRYLLNKLLHGEGQNSEEAGGAESAEVEDRKEADVSSEAGTYVVDVSKRIGNGQASQLMAAKIVEDSDSSDDTSSTESDTESECEEEAQTTARHIPSPPKPTPPIQQTPTCPPESETKKTTEKSDLAKELTKLRAMAGIRPTTSPAAQPQVSRPSGLYDHSRPGPATPPQQPPRPTTGRASLGAQPTNRNCLAASRGGGTAGSTASSSGPFRRGDGGRYSMRGANAQGVAPSSPQQNAKRPPFRAGVAPMRPGFGNPERQKEQEMNAWLRRKDYNPMKAAAEARRAKELKARGEQFMSNRSISFHVGPVMAKPARGDGFGEIIRNRSQESLAVEEAEHASQRVLAEYSRGVVQDISRLSQQSTRASGKQLSGLARAVDMLSQKCKKSIELIRSQNKGCLSVSVEDLLAAAAEPPRKGETLNEQLDRLSDAFDAVQRYLEQYSLEDGHHSPIPDIQDDASDIHSTVTSSSFSAHSIRSRQLSSESKSPNSVSSRKLVTPRVSNNK